MRMNDYRAADAVRTLPHLRRYLLIAAVIAAVLAAWGIISRIEALTALRARTQQAAIPTVAAIQPAQGPASEELVLPGTLQAYTDSPIYARTNGYLKRWLVDIGAKVKAGQLLAEIDAPEVDQELHQAEADLASAQANSRIAASTAARWKDLFKRNFVSRQSVDEKNSDAQAKRALAD